LIFALVIIILQSIYRYVTSREEGPSEDASPYAYTDNQFGGIEYPTIPSVPLADGSTPAFSIQGRFAQSPTSVNIYQIEKPRETLGSVAKGQSIAEFMKFSPNYQTVDNILVWQTENQARKLEYHKITRDIHYLNARLTKASYQQQLASSTDASRIDSTFTNILGSLGGSNYHDLENIVTYISEENSNYKTVATFEQADFVRRDSFIKLEEVSLKASYNQTAGQASPIQGIIYLDDPFTGIVNATLLKRRTDSSTVTNQDILKEFNEIGIIINSAKGVYKLKSIEEAWEDVRDGKASLRSLIKTNEDRFSIHTPLRVNRFIVNPDQSHLGYYLTTDWTGFIYPIYVFKGTAELEGGETAQFIFYTKAIAD